MLEIIVYSRHGCHLCEEMLEKVEPLCRGKAGIVVRDVDTRNEWADAYGLDVPVLFLNEREVCRHRLDEQVFIAALNDSLADQQGSV